MKKTIIAALLTVLLGMLAACSTEESRCAGTGILRGKVRR